MNDLFSVEGKTVVVTGGSRGIGLMIARGYVEAGATVIHLLSQGGGGATGTALSCQSPSASAWRFPADLSTEAECRRLADEVSDRTGGTLGQFLVNNAGATWGAPIDDFTTTPPGTGPLTSTSRGVFHMTKFLRPAAREGVCARRTVTRDQRRVDRRAAGAAVATYAYSASKAAVHKLTRLLAKGWDRGDHGQRGGAGAVRVEDDGRDAARGSGTRSRRRRRCGGSGGRTTWPGQRGGWPAGRGVRDRDGDAGRRRPLRPADHPAAPRSGGRRAEAADGLAQVAADREQGQDRGVDPGLGVLAGPARGRPGGAVDDQLVDQVVVEGGQRAPPVAGTPTPPTSGPGARPGPATRGRRGTRAR